MEFEYIFDDIEICECVGYFEDEYVYDIEVENTHCLIVNGVVAHNCMDALRYGLEGHIKNFDKNVGLVDATPRPDKIESFIVNEDGDAEAFHINLGEVAKRSQEEEWYQ